jgi:hypothetical protein
MTVDWGLLHNQPQLHADAAQYVSSMRNGVPAAREAVLDFVELGVADCDTEQLLINMRVHEKLVDAYLAVKVEKNADAARWRAKLQQIKRWLIDINGRALAIVRHGVHDGRLVSIEVFNAADVVEAYFESYPEEATRTEMRLGLAPERARNWTQAQAKERITDLRMAVWRAAIGRFAYLMREATPDHQTHPEMIAKPLSAFGHPVDYMEVRNYLRAYERRLQAAGA